MKTILFHVNKLKQIKHKQVNFHYEILKTARTFDIQGYKCLLTDWRNINKDFNTTYLLSYHNHTLKLEPNQPIHKLADIIFVKSMGNVEGSIKPLCTYLAKLRQRFNGKIINNPSTMIYGMTKHYLLQLQMAGFPTIPSILIDKYINLKDVYKCYKNSSLRQYQPKNIIIKPVTGEFGTAVNRLSEIDEEYFKPTDFIPQGWLLQPFQKSIYSGERSLIMVGRQLIHAVKKIPPKGSDFRIHTMHHTTDNVKYEEYNPTQTELKLYQDIYSTWQYPLIIWRLDLIGTPNKPLISEVETVNSGVYLQQLNSDKITKKYTTALLKYANK